MNTMTDRDFLKKQSHEQLEIFVLNSEMIIETLRDRLFLATGCPDFGGQDGTNGACVECFYNTPELHERCCLFQASSHTFITQKYRGKETNNTRSVTDEQF